jgi:hypothetical protein
LQTNTTCDVDEDGVLDSADNCPVVANADQIDSNASTNGAVNFTKSDYGSEEDCISDDVCLTRGDNQQIYNSVSQN